MSNDILYCLYVRKSSEQDEKQAMSIESQMSEMRKIQEAENLEVVKVIQESKSAKSSFSRPGFMDLMKGLVEKQYSGILTWSADRLSRNAGDLGMLIDLMDQNKLKVVRTHDRAFTGENPSEKFLLMLLCSQAKLENENRAEHVKRGLRSSCSRGKRPCPVPLGYKLIPGKEISDSNQVVVDEERAPLIKEVFRMVGEKNISAYQVWKDITKFKNFSRTGKVITNAQLYAILRNPFYYGEFEYPRRSGNWYKGTYHPLTTKEIFEKVQVSLNKNSERVKKYRWGNLPFKFNRIFKCGGCGSGICGEIHKDRRDRLRLYYRCNKSCALGNCQQLSIRGKDLLLQIDEVAKRIRESDIGTLSKEQQERLERYERLAKVSITPYAFIKCEFEMGSIQEKANALRALKGRLLIKDKQIVYEPT